MIGIVIVSHSAQLAEGVCDLARQMTSGQVPMAAAGGDPEGGLGTDVERIRSAIEDVMTPEGVLVLMDLGSAVMSAEVALEALDADRAGRVRLSNAPLVEGAVIAAVESSIGKSLDEVDRSALSAATMQKVER